MSCPICQKPVLAAYKPFCSRRCADIDLGRWLNESYTIPVAEDEDDRPADTEPGPQRPN
jgi:uncharacterized protein